MSVVVFESGTNSGFVGRLVEVDVVDDAGREEGHEVVEDLRLLLLPREADHRAHAQRQRQQQRARGGAAQLQHALRVD